MLSASKEDTTWSVARAKAKLSEVIERAQSSPQTTSTPPCCSPESGQAVCVLSEHYGPPAPEISI